jgi:hypothetical protein
MCYKKKSFLLLLTLSYHIYTLFYFYLLFHTTRTHCLIFIYSFIPHAFIVLFLFTLSYHMYTLSYFYLLFHTTCTHCLILLFTLSYHMYTLFYFYLLFHTTGTHCLIFIYSFIPHVHIALFRPVHFILTRPFLRCMSFIFRNY